jgi:hypothetical protein
METEQEIVRQTLMRMDEGELEDRLEKNLFTPEARAIAIEVLAMKREQPKQKPYEIKLSPQKRKLIAFGAIGLVSALIFGLRSLSKKGQKQH